MIPHASDKKRVAAALLCLLLGVVGVHRLYTGNVPTGAIQALITAGGLAVHIIAAERVVDAETGATAPSTVAATFDTASLIVLALVALWVVVDLIVIVAGRFRDAHRRRIA